MGDSFIIDVIPGTHERFRLPFLLVFFFQWARDLVPSTVLFLTIATTTAVVVVQEMALVQEVVLVQEVARIQQQLLQWKWWRRWRQFLLVLLLLLQRRWWRQCQLPKRPRGRSRCPVRQQHGPILPMDGSRGRSSRLGGCRRRGARTTQTTHGHTPAARIRSTKDAALWKLCRQDSVRIGRTTRSSRGNDHVGG